MSRTKSPDPVALSDPLTALVGYHLRRLSVRVMADLGRALAPLDLNPADASVLLMINANPGITQSEIGKAIGILRANMAPLVAELVGRGLVVREPVDGRSNALRTSPTGAALCCEVADTVAAHEQRMFGALSKETRNRLLRELRTLWETSPETP